MYETVEGERRRECLAVARHSGRGEKTGSAELLQDTVEGARRRGVSSWCKTQWKGREDEECLAVARQSGRGEKTRSA